MSGFEFSWNKEESIVVPRQDAIAVYENPNGEIVIRQQDEYGEHDQTVVVNAHAARSLAEAIIKQADELDASKKKEN